MEISEVQEPAEEAGKRNNASSDKGWEVFQNITQIFLRSLFDLLTKYGLPGIALFMGYYFLVSSGTEVQKQEMIERWFLGAGGDEYLPYGVGMVVMGMVFWGQWIFFRNRVKKLTRRNKALEGDLETLRVRFHDLLKRSNLEIT